jgi:hypothetical protein
MPRYRKPQPGDYFEVPLLPDGFAKAVLPPAFGQVLSLETSAMNSVACAFWPERTADVESLLRQKPVAVQLVTSDLLRNKHWPICGNAAISVPVQYRPYERFRSAEWVGAKIVGSGIMRGLLLAFRGLALWDDYADPHYLNGLLLPGVSPPMCARYKRARA